MNGKKIAWLKWMTMNEKEKLLAWLRAHPLINISGLEREAKIPPRAIRRALDGSRPLPDEHVPGIVKVLKKYGY